MTPSADASKRRRALPIAVLILATVVGVVSVLALWAKRQALETDTWVDTSTELLEDEPIRTAVSDFVVNTIYENVDVESEIAAALPPRVQQLAAPVAGGLRQLATRAAQRALQQPKVQALWEDANRDAHERLIALIDDEGEFVSTTDGTVTLDLAEIVGEVAAGVGISENVAAKLPPGAAEIEVMKSDELEAAQSGVKALRTLAWVLTGITLVLFALAIFLAHGWRREMLRAVGFAFIGVGAVALLARTGGGDVLTDALSETSTAEAPVLNTWMIGTSLLKETAESLIAYGVIAVLAAWLAGPSSVATSIRYAVTPYLRQRRFTYGGLTAVVVLLFWWNPVVATDRLVPSLLLVAVLAIGVEALRRQAIREFPDRVVTGSPEGIARALADRMREARERRVRAGEPIPAAASGPAAGAGRIDELERLARLRESGVITDEELAAEKRRILG